MKQFNTLLLKWGLCVGMVLGAVTAFAEAGSGTGKDIEMYTFFPVPSVSYNNIYVTDRFDVGTQKGPFTLMLGHPQINNDDITPSLQLDSSSIALLKGGTESSKNNLEWNVDIYTNEATFGNYSDAPASSTASQLTFNNLFAKELTKSTDHPADEINAKKVKVNGKMKMISNAFTSEEASALPGCAQAVSWNTFKIGGANRTFLECGEAPEEPTGPCEPGKVLRWKKVSPITCKVNIDMTSYHAMLDQNRDVSPVDILLMNGGVLDLYGINCFGPGVEWTEDTDLVFVIGGGSNLSSISTRCDPSDNGMGSGDHTPTLGVDCLDIMFTNDADVKGVLGWCSDLTPVPEAWRNMQKWPCTSPNESITWYQGAGSEGTVQLYTAVCENE